MHDHLFLTATFPDSVRGLPGFLVDDGFLRVPSDDPIVLGDRYAFLVLVGYVFPAAADGTERNRIRKARGR